MNNFSIKQNDTRPSIKVQLLGEYNEPRNLTEVTVNSVTFHMKSVKTGEIVINSNATIVNEENGIIAYEWSGDDTANSGKYKAEFQVEYENSGVETFPNNDEIDILIRDEIA